MKHIRMVLIILLVVGTLAYVGWNYYQNKEGPSFRPGGTYQFDEDKFAEYEPEAYQHPIGEESSDITVYGIADRAVNEINTAVFSMVEYVDGRRSASEKNFLRKTIQDRYDYRAESTGYLYILNNTEEALWAGNPSNVQKSTITVSFNEFYELEQKGMLEMYADILSRWDGQNEIVMFKGSQTLQVIYDIQLNVELQNELFYPPN